MVDLYLVQSEERAISSHPEIAHMQESSARLFYATKILQEEGETTAHFIWQ